MLATSVNKCKIEECKQKQKLIRKELRSRKKQEDDNNKPTGALSQKTESQLQAELLKLEEQVKQWEALTDEESRNRMFHHMQLRDREAYRAKLPIEGINDLNTNI